jgi:hypothetical protein
MAAIEYTLKNTIWPSTFAQEVEVMGKLGAMIRVPCIGFTNKSIADMYKRHYVKVIAERYTADNGQSKSDWKYISVDDAVLGWRTNEGSQDRLIGLCICYWMIRVFRLLCRVPAGKNRNCKRPVRPLVRLG